MRRLVVLGMVLALGIWGAFPAMTLAQVSAPDSVDVDYISVTRNLTETGDFLIIFYYEINYTSAPDESADQTFVFRLIDTDNTTEMGVVVPYPYNNDGYGSGAASFYFDASSAPTWGESYYIRVEGNPAHFADSYSTSFAINSGDYSDYTDSEANQQLTADAVMEIAEALELTWSAELRDETDVGATLSSVGERYFRRVIRGLQNMAPTVFLVQVSNLDYTPRTWTSTFADLLGARFDGTWVETGFDGLASLLNTEVQTAWGFVFAALCVLAMGFNYKKFKQVQPGFLDSAVILGVGTGLGAFSMNLHGLIAFLCIFIVGMVLFLNRA